MLVEPSLREVGEHIAMTQPGNFNLRLLVHFDDSLETPSKEKFDPSHLSRLPTPESTFSMSVDSYTPPSKWSASPCPEESQSSPHSSISLDSISPSYVPPPAVPSASPGIQTFASTDINALEPGTFSHYAQPNSAPLLDSRVYIFYSPSRSDGLDFACKGQGRKSRRGSTSNEGRMLVPGRSRAWSNPDHSQSVLSHKRSPHGPPGITSGYGREKKQVARVPQGTFKIHGHLAVRRPSLPHDGGNIMGRRKGGVRVSNKWGKHPPAGYF